MTDDTIPVAVLHCKDCDTDIAATEEEIVKHFFSTGCVNYKLKLAGTSHWKAVYGSEAQKETK